MPNNAKFNLIIDAQMEINDINKSIKAIQNNLSSLKIPTKLKSSFTDIFDGLESEIENFQRMSQSSFTSVSDVNKILKSFDTIKDGYSSLFSYAKRLEGIDLNNLIPQNSSNNIEKLVNAYSSWKKTIQSVTNEQEELNNAQEKMSENSKLLPKYQKQLDSLNGSLGPIGRKINEVLNLREKSKSKESTKEEVEESNRSLQELIKKYNDTVKARDKVETSSQYLNALRKQYDSTKKEADSYKDSIQKIKDETPVLDSKVDTLTKSLKDQRQELPRLENDFLELFRTISGINFKDININIQNEQQLKEYLKDVEIDKVNTSLKNIDTNARDGVTSVEQLGKKVEDLDDAAVAANNVANEIANMSNQAQQFFSISNSFQIFKDIVRQSFEAVKELDAALTETATVTAYSVADMWERVPEYTALAKDLGATITGVANVMTLYYQQGLNTEESIAAGTETLKMARIANMEYADATDLMTSALRGFNMEVNETNAQRVNDVYSELAAISATDTEELGIAMSKTASIASSANMDFETTAALLAQILETTREAPETA